MLRFIVYDTKINRKKRQKSLKSARDFPQKRRDILYPLHNTDILCVESNLFKGGKEDVHYVPDQSYQRFK